LYINYYSDPSIVRCNFNGNGFYGISAENYSYPDIKDCKFLENVSTGIFSDHSAWPYVKNCIFDGNNNNFYGLYGSYSDILIEDCIIRGQSSNGMSFYNSYLTVNRCKIESNNGYGIFCSSSSVEVKDCKIEENQSHGIYCIGSSLETSGCTIKGNGDDGVRLVSASFPTINNNIICNNKDNGIYTDNIEHTFIKNNLIYCNGDGNPDNPSVPCYDSGLYLKDSISTPFIRNNTIMGNAIYGIYVALGRDPCLINDIVWQNGSEPNKNIVSERGLEGIEASYCCIEGGFAGISNINCDPCFRNPDTNDYHLKRDSNCIDAGDPLADYEDENDIDGEVRIFDGDYNGTFIVDIGADEVYWPKADYNLDEIVDFIDFTFLAGAWMSTNNPSISLDADSDVDIYDLDEFCSDWLWVAPWSQFYEQFYSRTEGNSKIALVETNLSAGQGLIEAPVMITFEPLEDVSVYTVPEEPAQIMDEPTGDEGIERIIDWLEQIWESEPGLQDMVDPNDYERVIESLKEELDEP
jgi:hypothetical protein